MRTLILDSSHLRQLVVREDFYQECPAFAHLATTARDLLESRAKSKAAGTLPCCGNDWTIYRGLIDAVFLRLRELQAADDRTAIAALKRYLETKKGYRPDTVIVYYRRSGRGNIGKLTL